jgi:hypothetical protein
MAIWSLPGVPSSSRNKRPIVSGWPRHIIPGNPGVPAIAGTCSGRSPEARLTIRRPLAFKSENARERRRHSTKSAAAEAFRLP